MSDEPVETVNVSINEYAATATFFANGRCELKFDPETPCYIRTQMANKALAHYRGKKS